MDSLPVTLESTHRCAVKCFSYIDDGHELTGFILSSSFLNRTFEQCIQEKIIRIKVVICGKCINLNKITKI